MHQRAPTGEMLLEFKVSRKADCARTTNSADIFGRAPLSLLLLFVRLCYMSQARDKHP